jgi:hypothetical protein
VLASMTYRPTTLERAFELATSGKVDSIDAIRLILKLEGYDDLQFAGPHLVRQLRVAIFHARRTLRRA